jgi:Zn finger protein HypA/HybF involved in hydrogenase expression
MPVENFDWENFHPVSTFKVPRDVAERAAFLQCQNCDYIGKPKEFPDTEIGNFSCPSCGDADAVIVDLSKPFYLSQQEIIDQIAWQ